MDYAPLARIGVRYIVGLVLGANAAEIIAGDPDIIALVAAGIGVAVEAVYVFAKKKGWAT